MVDRIFVENLRVSDMKIDLKISGLKEAQARIRGLNDSKIKAATVAALNDGARAGYVATRNEMLRVFDRPTPWTLKGHRYEKATKENVEASIDFDYWGNKYFRTVEQTLIPHIEGGPRLAKRHEYTLQALAVMPKGMVGVPGEAATIDRYGNMSPGQIRQIQSWFGAAQLTAGYDANSTARTRAKLGRDNKRTGARGFQYFALQKKRGKLLPGIYQRFTTAFGSAIKPVIIFVSQATYRKRFDFYGVGMRAAQKQIDISFDKYLDQMLKERGL